MLNDEMDIPYGKTVFVRIGKCGGTSVRHALVSAGGRGMYTVHVRKPPIREDLKYIILARNPISRARSAFNWRHHLLVKEGRQLDRFQGELEVLQRYGNFECLAEALYSNAGEESLEAAADYGVVHHLKEGIAFHLQELLQSIKPDQIAGVMMQETLQADAERLLSISIGKTEKENVDTYDTRLPMSALAERNLKRFLEPEFACLLRLYCWGKLDDLHLC